MAVNNNYNNNCEWILKINNSLFNNDINTNNNNNKYNNNETVCLEHAPTISSDTFLRCFILIIMAIISLIGNLATIWNIENNRLTTKFKRKNLSAIYRLILHLSIADLCVTGFCIIGEAIWSYTVEWLANDIICKLIKYFQMFSLYLSTYVLVLIGIDRWIAVKYPIKSLNTSKRCNRFLLIAYILSLLLSLPQSIIFRKVRGPFIEEFYQCHTEGFYTAEWQEQLYTTFTLIFMFIIPLIILITTYLSTFRTISGSAQVFNLGVQYSGNLQNNCIDSTRRRLIHKAKKKSLQISLVIVCAFLICWTPYYIMMIIFMFLNPDKHFGEDLQSAIFFFGMSNSLINPLIYGAFQLWTKKSSKFRRDSSKNFKEHNNTVTQQTGCSRQNSKTIIPLQHKLPETIKELKENLIKT